MRSLAALFTWATGDVTILRKSPRPKLDGVWSATGDVPNPFQVQNCLVATSMISFVGPNVWAEITAAAKASNNPVFVAVAYFGKKGDALLPLAKNSTLVVDASINTVSSGGTCPAALRPLLKRGVKIFSAQNLHAKVFVFDDVAFVGSANASTRSQKHLVEAVVKSTDAVLVTDAREFVQGIAVTALTDADLIELQKSYKPPKAPKLLKKQIPLSTLVMELTLEQGIGRETQVQPPRSVWETFFGVNYNGPYPTLKLTRTVGGAPSTFNHKVVKHHHNLTVELPGAEMPRPAILEIRRVGTNSYEYEVHRPPSKRYTSFTKLLTGVKNPLWTSGRKWDIV